MMVLFHVGEKEVVANWAMVEHQIKLHLHPRAALEQAALLSPSLLEMLTPVQFSMTVLFHVGGKEVMANWAMVEHQIKLDLHPRAALEQAALLSPSLLEVLTPVQFSMTVLSHVGEKERVADWATVKDMITKTLHQLTALEQVALLSPSLLEVAHTCAILDDGSVSCWGEGGTGRLGTGASNTNEFSPTPTSTLGTGRTAVAISSGRAHTCAILDDGSVSCWGEGYDGQLGNGGTSDKTTPTPTSSLGTGRIAVAISSGRAHTCVTLDDGSVSCWGKGGSGRLGNGGLSDVNTPTLTSSLGTGRIAVAISSGEYHTCVILDDGSVSCWGKGVSGRLGNSGTSDV